MVAALVAATGCAGNAGGYRAAHFGDLLAAGGAAAGLHAFKADRAREIRGAFNASNCAECHVLPALGGTQRSPMDFVIKQSGPGGAVTFERYAVEHGVAKFRYPKGPYYLRKPPPLYGIGLLESVPVAELRSIVEQQARVSPRHQGRIAILGRGVVGRFGWKAHIPTLPAFVATAFAIELGIHDTRDVGAVTHYLRVLAAPPSATVRDVSRGRGLFEGIGCADCHRPALRTGKFIPGFSYTTIDAYTDLLLHDMGPKNAELPEGVASATEFRTPPLWGAGSYAPYMHNGRARTLSDAIALHGGQAADSAAAFGSLSQRDRAALLEFLRSL